MRFNVTTFVDVKQHFSTVSDGLQTSYMVSAVPSTCLFSQAGNLQLPGLKFTLVLLTVFYVSQSGKTKQNHTQTLLSPLCYFWCQKLPLSKSKEGESEGWDVLDVSRSFRLPVWFLLCPSSWIKITALTEIEAGLVIFPTDLMNCCWKVYTHSFEDN